MMMFPDAPSLTPADQAARILAAWTSQNATGLHEELRRSLELSEAQPAWGIQEERLQLLRAVTEGMQDAADPLTPGDPKLRRCLYLLRHLAETR
ncbi:MAG TPA: hypothetical protein VG096_12100 [Bryobacteraceae bacterium]|jgi:hypothetical protein|nr:hypothetical protein [Bryobacteraceae bacterium]